MGVEPFSCKLGGRAGPREFDALKSQQTLEWLIEQRADSLSAGRNGCYLGYSLAACETRRGGVFHVPAITYGKFEFLMRTPDIRPYQGKFPRIAASAYIDPAAVVIGDVVIGEESSLWPMTVVRGDVHHIRIGNRTNIQDGSVLHVMKDQYPLVLGDEVTVGHSVTLHGCTIHSHVLIGMGCIILNGAVIGSHSIIAAGTLITERTVIPEGSLVMGSPGKVKRQLLESDQHSIAAYAERYVQYAATYRNEVASGEWRVASEEKKERKSDE